MYDKKLIGFFLIALILAVCIGTASASENTTLTSANEEKTFTDIQTAIDNASENDTIELEGTYKSQGSEIKIDKAITISSKNGATLDAQFKSNIFNISNVNVCLKNLNLINSNSSNPAVKNQGNLTVIDSNFTNNTMIYPEILTPYEDFVYPEILTPYEDFEKSAGAIYSTNNLNIINCEFENNEALALMWDYGDYVYFPIGGMINSKRNLIITKSRFTDGYIESYGILNITDSKFTTAPIYAYSNTTIAKSTLTRGDNGKSTVYAYSKTNINDCNFTANEGYSIFVDDTETEINITVSNCRFENNTPKSSRYYDEEFLVECAVIHSESNDIFIYDSEFINNAPNAIFNNWGHTYVSNSIFSKTDGVAIRSYKTTVINSTFINNIGYLVGAIYTDSLEVSNSTFTSNKEGAIKANNVAVIDGVTYKGPVYFDDSLKKTKIITSTTKKLTTTYMSGKTLALKMFYTKSKRPLTKYQSEVKIIKGKSKTYDYIYTNSKGIAYFKASNLNVGTYKIIFNYDDNDVDQITTTVKITKAKTIIKAPKVTAKHKKSKYFKVSIKSKATKKAVKNTYVKVKIDKKTYKIKTNSKGVAKFNTKKLKIGKHKVVISSGNSNYIMSAKSTITIKK